MRPGKVSPAQPKGKVNNPVKYVDKKSKPVTATPTRDSSVNISVRKIDNGYIVSESRCGPKGYECKERYSASAPKVDIKTK